MTITQDALLKQIQEIDAYAFEQFIGKLWELQGWDTFVTKETGDGGIDIVAEKSRPFPTKQVIQVKRYEPTNSVGRPDIQQYASIRQEQTDVDTVVVVTTGRFTDGAEDVGNKLNVKLIDGPRLYNLIDALNAFQLAESYVTSEINRDEATSTDGEAKKPTPLFEKANEVEKTQSEIGINKNKDIKDVPTFLPSLIKLRGEIKNDLHTLQSNLRSAKKAFDSQRYFDAVEQYQEANKQQREVKRKIARYDAGLANIDRDTAEHLPSTETFTDHLSRITENVHGNMREAFRVTERAKGLEALRNEICDHVDSIEHQIKEADKMRQNGKVQKAQKKYKQAKRSLEQPRQTMDIYQGLIAEYDDEIIEAHDGSQQEISLSELEAKITERMESKEDFLNIQNIAEEAAGSFSARVLTGNHGELFENDLIDYLIEDEKLEFVFEPPRMGFRTGSTDEPGETPYHDALESGSCFLLITDQRILYVAGIDDHDETRTFKFHQLSNVEAYTDATSPSLKFTSEDGRDYKFEGLRNHTPDLEPAARFIRSHIK